MAVRALKLTDAERSTLAGIADGTLYLECPTRPRVVNALLELGLIECDGEHYVATAIALPHLRKVRQPG